MVGGPSAAAENDSYQRSLPPKLAAQAKISSQDAEKIALNKVPTGKIIAVELEREAGKLLYSIDVKMPGSDGVEELHVSAIDGQLLSQQHESPQKERAEKRSEKKESTK
jgi:uncharacterized membrane protein YkoI